MPDCEKKNMDSIFVLGPIQRGEHISYDSTPSSACRGQKRGCNPNMHNIQSNKSVKREQHGLPVAWGRDIITKCPRLVENVDKIRSVSVHIRPPEVGGSR